MENQILLSLLEYFLFVAAVWVMWMLYGFTQHFGMAYCKFCLFVSSLWTLWVAQWVQSKSDSILPVPTHMAVMAQTQPTLQASNDMQ
jgi:hypothetical protein